MAYEQDIEAAAERYRNAQLNAYLDSLEYSPGEDPYEMSDDEILEGADIDTVEEFFIDELVTMSDADKDTLYFGKPKQALKILKKLRLSTMSEVCGHRRERWEEEK